MHSSASRLIRLGAVATASLALALAGVASAMAAAPDGTAILSDVYLNPSYSEVGEIVITGSCDSASYAAEVHYENVTTGDVGLYFQNLDDDKNFVFAEDPLNNMGDPGDELSIWIVCVLVDNTPTATSDSQGITLIDFGASIAVADVAVGATITVTGTCGTAEDVTHVNYVVFGLSPETLIAEGSYATTGGAFVISGIPSPASVGLAAPGEGYAAFQCISSGDGGDQVLTEWRGTTFAILPAPAPVLPNMGFAAAPGLILGGLLAAGGLLLVVIRRTARP